MLEYLIDNGVEIKSNTEVKTIEQIKNHIGISTTTRSNDEIVSNILFVLQKLGVIKYTLATVKQDSDSFNNVKTIHQLDWITNDIAKIKC